MSFIASCCAIAVALVVGLVLYPGQPPREAVYVYMDGAYSGQWWEPAPWMVAR